jgi:hypothetical protein
VPGGRGTEAHGEYKFTEVSEEHIASLFKAIFQKIILRFSFIPWFSLFICCSVIHLQLSYKCLRTYIPTLVISLEYTG